jgi:hypothetical protein
MGQPLAIVPLSALATGTLPREQQGQASALFNVKRNLAYGDCFFIMGLALVASIAVLWLVPAPRRD